MISPTILKLITSVRSFLDRTGRNFEVFTKPDGSPVTTSDLGVQILINRFLIENYPDDKWISEESDSGLPESFLQKVTDLLRESDLEENLTGFNVGQILQNRGNVAGKSWWMVDPIDGTRGFLRNEQFSVCLARFTNGKPVLGLLICPNLPFPDLDSTETGAVFYWEKGSEPVQFSYRDFETKNQISVNKNPTGILLTSVERDHSRMEKVEKISQGAGFGKILSFDSQVKYGLLARGEAEALLRIPGSDSYKEKVWDHAAGLGILEAAGGQVSDVNGLPFIFSGEETLSENFGLLASNGICHFSILQQIKEIR
ncbi:MAG: hypothetical protein LCH54_06535 [Bacteroidetes bacterium]|nr:hypothetical protein [Bacteroidota bacterium]